MGPLPRAFFVARAIISRIPRPIADRQAWERELREELPGQLTRYQEELAATPPESRERRERLEWQIRRVQKRMAEVERRLAALGEAR